MIMHWSSNALLNIYFYLLASVELEFGMWTNRDYLDDKL